MRGISKNPVPACGTGLLPRRSTVPALGSSRNLPDSDLLDLPDQSDCLNGEVETHGTSTLNKCQTPPRHARRGFRGRRWVRVAVQVAVQVGTRIAGAEVRDGVGSAARVLVLAEGPRAVRRTVNPNRDRDEQAMLEVLEAPWIPDGDGLGQQSWFHIVPFRRAAGEGGGVGGWEAPPVRRPESRVRFGDPAKDPARRGLDPRSDPCHNLNFRPIRRH